MAAILIVLVINSLQIRTKAPLECMCRPCTGIDESSVVPQEIAGYADEGPLSNHFVRPSQTE